MYIVVDMKCPEGVQRQAYRCTGDCNKNSALHGEKKKAARESTSQTNINTERTYIGLHTHSFRSIGQLPSSCHVGNASVVSFICDSLD